MVTKQKAIELARIFNLDNELVNLYDSIYNRNPHINQQLRDYEHRGDTKGKILFSTLEGKKQLKLFREGILAHAFRKKGYEPHFLLCNESLDMCHGKENFDCTAACSICTTRGDTLIEKFGISPIYSSNLIEYSEFENEPINTEMEKYHGIPIKDYVNASFRRMTRTYSIDLSDNSDLNLYRRILRSAIIVVELAETLFNSYDIDVTITSSPAYIYGGILMETSKKFGVPAYAHSHGYLDQHIRFGNIDNRLPLTTHADDGLVRSRLEQSLSTEERQWVIDFFEKLQSGEVRKNDYSMFGERGLDNPNGQVFGLFPNLAWDSKMDSRNLIFSDPFEWIESTISFFKNQTEKYLVIKPHPAEAIYDTNESFFDWINDRFDLSKNSFDNVTVLPPNTEVDQYQMVQDIDAGIVVDSTIGLEMTHIGTPAIVVGNAHYRGHGFTFDPQKEAEYQQLLLNTDELEVTTQMTELCNRYAYLSYNERHVPFKYHDYSSESVVLKNVKHQDIDNDKYLDLIVEKVSKGEPVALFDTEC